MTTPRVRLRDLVETKDRWIFSVLEYGGGDDGVRCMLRYVPSPEGDRERNGLRFRKVGFEEANALVQRERPEYLKGAMVVPFDDIAVHHKPHDGLLRILDSDRRVRMMVDTLIADDIDVRQMGITGSRLAGLDNDESDVDFIVYGNDFYRARVAVARAIASGRIGALGAEDWEQAYERRNPELDFEEFCLHERRKGNRCLLDGALTDLHFVRSWDQVGARVEMSEKLGVRTITAKVSGVSFPFDAPVCYEVEHPEISRVLSFTHTYAGQAFAGETIEARGWVEQFTDGMALIVGTSREAKGEWIKSLTLLGRA